MRIALSFSALGTLFIFLTGSLLHFFYGWSDERWWVGIFSAMNESVWEHLKLAFWPAVAWSLIGLATVRRQFPNYWLGQLIAVSLPPLIIAFGFYGYTAALGGHTLSADLILFFCAIGAGQFAGLVVSQSRPKGKVASLFAVVMIVSLCLIFASLSSISIDMALFREPPRL